MNMDFYKEFNNKTKKFCFRINSKKRMVMF